MYLFQIFSTICSTEQVPSPLLVKRWQTCIALLYSLETFVLVFENRLDMFNWVFFPQIYFQLFFTSCKCGTVSRQKREINLSCKCQHLFEVSFVITVCFFQTRKIFKSPDPTPDCRILVTDYSRKYFDSNLR